MVAEELLFWLGETTEEAIRYGILVKLRELYWIIVSLVDWNFLLNNKRSCVAHVLKMGFPLFCVFYLVVALPVISLNEHYILAFDVGFLAFQRLTACVLCSIISEEGKKIVLAGLCVLNI